MNGHVSAPICPAAKHRPEQIGGVLRTDLAGAELEDLGREAGIGDGGQAVQVAVLVDRRERMTHAGEDLLELGAGRVRRDDGEDGRREVGVDALAALVVLCEELPRLCDDRLVLADRAERGDEGGAKERHLLGFATRRSPADSLELWLEDLSDEGCEQWTVLLLDDAIAKPERADDDRPHVGFVFVGEVVDHREEVGERAAPGEGERPQVGDQAVALAGLEERRGRRSAGRGARSRS